MLTGSVHARVSLCLRSRACYKIFLPGSSPGPNSEGAGTDRQRESNPTLPFGGIKPDGSWAGAGSFGIPSRAHGGETANDVTVRRGPVPLGNQCDRQSTACYR